MEGDGVTVGMDDAEEREKKARMMKEGCFHIALTCEFLQ